MPRNRRSCVAILLCYLVVLTGCHPTQPFYLHEDRDLSHYLSQATTLDYPDVEQPSLAEVEQTGPPLMLTHPEFAEFWDITLEECVALALQNSKMLRDAGAVAVSPVLSVQGVRPILESRARTTVNDPAITESQPRFGGRLAPGQLTTINTLESQGVEGALSEFDAQVRSTTTWNKRDRPANRVAPEAFTIPLATTEDTVNSTTELSKKTAPGAEWFLRSVTDYNIGNAGGGVQPPGSAGINPITGEPNNPQDQDGLNRPPSSQALSNFWTQAIEIEVRQPLLRGRGTQINRIPVMVARTNTDIDLARMESELHKLVMQVEILYWDLYRAYQILEANKDGRDQTLDSWKVIEADLRSGGLRQRANDEANARSQYYFFRGQVEGSWSDMVSIENQLRFLIGLAPSDKRLMRPADQPSKARVEFDWHDLKSCALIRRPELRQQKWEIKRKELELIYAKNQLLPRVNINGLYRWLGLGDDLGGGRRNGLNFPRNNSRAWDNLTEGDFQELQVILDIEMPVGFRNELTRVRRNQLQLARESAVLEDMELEVVHQISQSLRNLDQQYHVARSSLNQWVAAEDEVAALRERLTFEQAANIAFQLLNAQRRYVDARTTYYRTLSEYTKSIADVHYRKGSLLEYNNVHFGEGPWPQKAYWDAHGEARKRDASYYLNYGWTRPGVISRGPAPTHSTPSIPAGAHPVPVHGEGFHGAPVIEPSAQAPLVPNVPSYVPPPSEPAGEGYPLPQPTPAQPPSEPTPGTFPAPMAGAAMTGAPLANQGRPSLYAPPNSLRTPSEVNLASPQGDSIEQRAAGRSSGSNIVDSGVRHAFHEVTQGPTLEPRDNGLR